MTIKPAVDRLETDLASLMPVLRLDIASSVGGGYANEFAVQFVPTLIVLNEFGSEVGRFHLDVPNADQVAELVAHK